VKIKLKFIKEGVYQVAESFTLCGHTIPEDFTTDLDSVPRIPVIYTLLKSRATVASILHDYLYSIRTDKKIADNLFLQAMKNTGVKRRYRYPIYWAVVLFGK
jgi:hypothetical protein